MTNQNDHPAVRFLTNYAAAVFAKDLDAFTSLYDRNVAVFDAWDEMSCQGLDALQKMTNEWFTSLGTERVVVEFEDERSSVSAALAYASAIVRFTANSADGEPLRSLQNRMTIVLENQNGEWKVVHQHTSSPIDLKTMKAML